MSPRAVRRRTLRRYRDTERARGPHAIPHQADPCRGRTRPDDRRHPHSDPPDDHLRPAVGGGLHDDRLLILPIGESNGAGLGTQGHRPGRGGGCGRVQHGNGGDQRRLSRVPQRRRSRSRVGRRLWRHVPFGDEGLHPLRGRLHLCRHLGPDCGRSRRWRHHALDPHRDSGQPHPQADRHRCRVRDRGRPRDPARRRQHVPHSVLPAAPRARGRPRDPFDDEVPRWPQRHRRGLRREPDSGAPREGRLSCATPRARSCHRRWPG